MLGTLEGIGAVARDDDDRTYRIGMGLVELAGAVDASAALATLVRPHLTDLSRSHRGSGRLQRADRVLDALSGSGRRVPMRSRSGTTPG